MLIRLFDIEDNKVMPTEHCYTISWLKEIMDTYPLEYVKIYTYIQYMSCPDARYNPYLNIDEIDREQTVRADVGGEFDSDDPVIEIALENAKKMYQTPTYRMWLSAKNTLDKLGKFLEDTTPTGGRDGNIAEIRNTLKQLPELRKAYNELFKELVDENNERLRGDADEAYDLR